MNKTNYHLNNNLKLPAARNAIVIVVCVAALVSAWFFLSPGGAGLGFLLVPVVLLCLVNFLLLHFIYRHMVEMRHDYNQLTEFIQLKEKIGGGVTLPMSRGYAASPDFLNEVLDTIQATEPKRILEASCGISTIAISEFLLRNGLTEVEHIALEHDGFYAQKCQSKIRNPKSRVITAPIEEHLINGKKWKWYSTEMVEGFKGIDLFIIDGPPAYLQKHSRYPALPLLRKNLAPGCVILLDDSHRPEERSILARWKEEHHFDYEILGSEKGIGKMVDAR